MGDLRCPIVELRQYTLHHQQRDVLIELFEREFVETQEAAGITVLGQFRDLDDPDRFVWIRGFDTMPCRAEALGRFYGGPVWQAHREAANVTMIDSDNVLLLRPASAAAGFPRPTFAPPSPDEPAAVPPSRLLATLWQGEGRFTSGLVEFFEQIVRPVLAETGGEPLAYLRSEHAPNTFPALPVRTGEEIFVWFTRFADTNQMDGHIERLESSRSWRKNVLPPASAWWSAGPQRLRLEPTARSLLR
ncbi:NIPSNAP family protein [Actinoplanes sp. NPDC051343]|uniref:NIPSNAP family protein n=1 Tax=Actinoplanes sp. NPDC051343 TaxID=3363906 RepID=UPI0037AA90F7